MNAWSITKPLALASGIAALLAAALLAFFAFGAESAQAAKSTTIKVNPIDVELPVATGEVGTTTIDLTNSTKNTVEIGAIDLSILEGTLGDVDEFDIQLLDSEGIELLDLDSILEALGLGGILDPDDLLGDPLDLPEPLELQPGETVQLVLNVAPDTEGALLTIDLLTENLTTILPAPINVVTNAQGCTISGTSEDDTLIDTPGNDVICGGDGNDTITASLGGSDTVLGQSGNDTIDLRDRVRANDIANGGDGADVCRVDKKDRFVNCGKNAKKAK